MNADLRRLMDNLRVRLPGALDATVQLEFFSVMNEFFQETNVWTEDIDIPVVAGLRDYILVPSGVAVINRLMGVVNSDERPVGALMKTPGELHLMNSPNQAATYTAEVALTITDPVTREGYPEFPDWVLNKYGTDLLDGTLGRMMTQPAKPYSNERLSIFHMRRFETAKSKAKVEAQHRNVYRGQSWRFPQSFASRNWR